MFDIASFLSAGLVFSTLCFALAVAWLVASSLIGRAPPAGAPGVAIAAVAVSAAVAFVIHPQAALSGVIPGAAIIGLGLLLLHDFTPAGRLLLVSHLLVVGWTLPYGAWFLATIDVSALTRALLFAGYPLMVVMMPVSLISTYGAWEVLCRRTWRRPRSSLVPAPRSRYPKVSIHVPARAEPPDVVMATLDYLAALDYPNFEVLVIDNNTPDEALWRPVEAHCRVLGDRFRFFHIERLTGAKAGALNFAMRHTADDAEVIALVDSDYQARPDFISALIGFLDDPKIGFVQTPHEYRDWEQSTYLRWLRWESNLFFHTTMVTMNERDAALIVGTMCLIRRQAIVEAGGWAEWCLTEDSEMAIRINSVGYSSVYINEAFGRGLIPTTFSGLTSQRFRWTYGPIQELKRHLRLFLPGPLGRPSLLTSAHKLHHLHHGLDGAKIGIGVAVMPFGIAAAGSLVAHGERVAVPAALLLAGSAVLLSGFVLKGVVYRSKGCSMLDALGSLIAIKALSHTVTMASLASLLGRPASWHRTNKFRGRADLYAAIRSATPELTIGALIVVLMVGVFVFLPASPLFAMLLFGAAYQSTNLLCAPIMALLSWHHLRAEQGEQPETRRAPAAIPITVEVRDDALA